MSSQAKHQLIAHPNVLSNQTTPNTLGGIGSPPARVERRRVTLPQVSWRTLALIVGAIIAFAWLVIGRAG